MTLPIVAISIGDPAGIGPEIALKAALDPRVRAMCRPMLVGDRRVLDVQAEACGIVAEIRNFASADAVEFVDERVALVALDHFADRPVVLGKIDAANGRAAVDAARVAIEAAMAGQVDAVVAAPQTESAIHAAGIEFDGYPSFVARCTGVPVEDAFLMLCFDDKRIVHTTLHVGVGRALQLITEDRVVDVITAADRTLRRLGIAAPRIAVSGLNPHAGEGGLFGDEEIRIIGPGIARAKAAQIRVDGPFGADTMFHLPGYDAFVVMLHDQGHITAKLLAQNRTAGLTIGTPILFSSVAHGSALDIAGQGKANPEAVVEAINRLVGGAKH
jgi:4-hydroxythreonine-4-phosphate dehydrogenase